MYDEIDIVLQSINNIRSVFPESIIVTVQSDAKIENEKLQKIKETSNRFILLEDLSNVYHPWELPARAVSRNISKGCYALYEIPIDFECILIITGDTLIIDAHSINRRYEDMVKNNWIAMVSQAIGQPFHASSDDPPNGIKEHRVQHENITDFMPQFVILNGKHAIKYKVFSNIVVTNRWTSEQCLGDDLLKSLDNQITSFKEKVGILNSYFKQYAYAYNDGIKYNARNNKPGR